MPKKANLALFSLLALACIGRPGGEDTAEKSSLGLSLVGTAIPADYLGQHVYGATSPPWNNTTLRLWDDNTAWCDLEPNQNNWPNNWNWAGLDALVNNALSHGYTNFVMVLGGPADWASPAIDNWNANPYMCAGSSSNGRFTNPPVNYVLPNNKTLWQNYVFNVAWHFRNVLLAGRPDVTVAYEVWNEPGNVEYFNPAAGNYITMQQLTSAAYWELKNVDSTARLLSGSLNPHDNYHFNNFDKNYVQYLAYAGWPVDGISFHSYSNVDCNAYPAWRSSTSVAFMAGQHQNQISMVTEAVTTKSMPTKISIWETEVNHARKDKNCPAWYWYNYLSDDQQTQLTADTLLQALMNNLSHQIWYRYNNEDPTNELGVKLFDNSAAERTLTTMRGWITGRTWQGCSPVTAKGVSIVYCALFNGSYNEQIVWSTAPVDQGVAYGTQCTLPSGDCRPVQNHIIHVKPTPMLIK